jgi:DNA segregation ATPase FtsK/SpoIIIE, S-DNA-T family
MREQLELQANQIELVLASHKIPSRVVGGTVTPLNVRFELAMRMDTRLAQLKGLSEEIALSLHAPSCRVVRDNGALNIEVPRSDPLRVALLDVCRRLAFAPPCSPVLGLDEKGTPLLLNLPSPDVAHVLVAGTPGSGKTALARAMALSLALRDPQRQLQLLLIDPKSRGFAPLAELPHLLCPPVTTVGEALSRLTWLVQEMERRDAQGINQPRLVVFMDELADLLMVGGREMEYVLTRLSQRWREAGVHLVACTQKPTVAVIGSLTKANFPARIVGSVTSPEEARNAAGISGTGAERLQGRGDFLLVHKGQTTRFAAAYVSAEDAAQQATRMRVPIASGGDRRMGASLVLRRVK